MQAKPPFKSPNAIFSFYHPVASVIVSCLEKRANFISRGLFEVRNLQSENFVSEKFAITTYSRLIEGFLKDFTFLQKDVEVVITGVSASNFGKLKVYESEKPAKYRLLFCPIDSITNFSRGLNECGSSFLLQSILPSGSKHQYENVFSCFYSFKLQKFLYAENKGLVYLENKRMKALNRKTSLIASINSASLMENAINTSKLESLRVRQILSRESIVSDCFDITNGSIDALIYSKIKFSEAQGIAMLGISLGLYTSNLDENSELNSDVNLVVGSENFIKIYS